VEINGGRKSEEDRDLHVGGGKQQRGHSSGALLWVAEGAEWAGLSFNWTGSELAKAVTEAEPLAALGDRSTPGLPHGPRRAAGAAFAEAIAAPTHVRHQVRPTSYRPPHLGKLVAEAPNPWSEPAAPAEFPPP